jgi:ankyrin repeat protein
MDHTTLNSVEIRAIDNGSNPYIVFSVAISNGEMKIIEYLLTTNNKKHKVNISHDDNYALVNASTSGHIEVVKFLISSVKLKKHIKANARNSEALMMACVNGHKEVAQYLLDNGASLPALDKMHADDVHVFSKAASKDHKDIIKLILDKYEIEVEKDSNLFLNKLKVMLASSFNMMSHKIGGKETILKKLTRKNKEIVFNKLKHRILIEACESDAIEVVNYLLDKKIPNAESLIKEKGTDFVQKWLEKRNLKLTLEDDLLNHSAISPATSIKRKI